jgi:lysophospholipase L1-like esterase
MQVEGGKRLKRAMMPDSLHPSPEGMDKLASCLQPILKQNGVSTAEN